MADKNDSIAFLVFAKNLDSDIGKLSLDGNMLKVLLALDGEKNLMQVSNVVGMDFSTVKVLMAKLLKLNVIRRVEVSFDAVEEEFFESLTEQLVVAMGPVAQVALRDTFDSFGYDSSHFPVTHVNDLVKALCEHIQRTEKKIEFREEMSLLIKEFGYL